jgi:hypothetical protein
MRLHLTTHVPDEAILEAMKTMVQEDGYCACPACDYDGLWFPDAKYIDGFRRIHGAVERALHATETGAPLDSSSPDPAGASLV